jgi:hypothetical protein
VSDTRTTRSATGASTSAVPVRPSAVDSDIALGHFSDLSVVQRRHLGAVLGQELGQQQAAHRVRQPRADRGVAVEAEHRWGYL